MPNLARRTTTPHLRRALACVSTAYRVTSSDLSMRIPVIHPTCAHLVPLSDAFPLSLLKVWGNPAATTTAGGAQREIWVGWCSWAVEVQVEFGKSLSASPWSPGLCLGDVTLSSLQEDQVQLRNLRAVSKSWRGTSGQCLSHGVSVWATHLLTEWQLKAEASAEDSLLPALYWYCSLCKYVRLGVQKHTL